MPIEKLYWGPEKALSYNCCFNIIESLRGGGKTVGILKYVLNDFIKRGRQFIYFRRYEKDIDLVKNVLFDDLVNIGVKEAAFVRVEHKQILFNRGPRDNKGKPKPENDMLMGLCLSFADQSRLKSLPLPKVKTFIFEEYIPENGTYLGNEMFKLMSMYESIDRSRDNLVMFLLGNHFSDNNPYYRFFGITPKKESHFTHIKKKSCLIERFKSEGLIDKRMKTRFGSLIGDTEYGKFINGIATMDNIEFVEKINDPFMKEFINLNGHGVFITDNYLYVREKKNTKQNYALSPVSGEKAIDKNVLNIIQSYLLSTRMRFESIEVKTELWPLLIKGTFIDLQERW